jgi:hypothetical protein
VSEAAVPILRFRAGTVPCGIAARDVHALRDAVGDRPPLWRLLGLARGPDDEAREARGWIVRLAHRDAMAEVVVQGPIEITDVRAADVLPRPCALALRDRDLVMGFARCARELVILLDIPALVARAG